MSKKWAYFVGVFFLLVIRVFVLDIGSDDWLNSLGMETAARWIGVLKNNTPFNTFIGGWALPAFVFAVLVFWITDEDETGVPMQFLLLPIVYVPFTVVGETLAHAEFNMSYLWVHPLIVLPFGYLYVGLWTGLIWIGMKIKIVKD